MVIPLKLLYSNCHSVSSIRNYQALEESMQESYHVKKKADCKMWMKRSDLCLQEREFRPRETYCQTERTAMEQKNLLCHSGVALTNITHRFIRKWPHLSKKGIRDLNYHQLKTLIATPWLLWNDLAINNLKFQPEVEITAKGDPSTWINKYSCFKLPKIWNY